MTKFSTEEIMGDGNHFLKKLKAVEEVHRFISMLPPLFLIVLSLICYYVLCVLDVLTLLLFGYCCF